MSRAVELSDDLWADCARVAKEQGFADVGAWVRRRLRTFVDDYTTMGDAAAARLDHGI